MKRGWFNDSVRHSLAAKGVRTNYYARRRRLLTSELFAESDAARKRVARKDEGVARERMAASLAARRSLAETELPEDVKKELEQQREIESFTKRQQERVKMAEADMDIAEALNMRAFDVATAGSGGYKSAIDKLERADLGNIDQEKALRVLNKRIMLENVQAEPRANKLKFLTRAKELVSMSEPARLQETIMSQQPDRKSRAQRAKPEQEKTQ